MSVSSTVADDAPSQHSGTGGLGRELAASESTDADLVRSLLALAPLFDVVPEVFLYVKDRRSRFVHVNRHWLDIRGIGSVAEVVGKSDFDLHPAYLARRYVAEDRRVMDSGEPLLRQVWLVPGASTWLQWYESSKYPLRHPDRPGEIIGLAGVMWALQQANLPQPSQLLDEAIARVVQAPAEEHPVPELAAAAGLSVSQFERRFKQRFQMTPRQYIQRVRVHAACERLLHTEESIAEIAIASGFYDQSHFTKAFGQIMGQPPAKYRRETATGSLPSQ